MGINQYYNVKIRIETEVEDSKGRPKIKVVPEQYLIHAVSPTDAEAKMTSKLDGMMAEFEVTNISLTKILDVLK